MTKLFKILPFISSIVCVSSFGQPLGAPDGSAVVFEIDGQKVTLGELEQKHPGRLFSAYNTFYQAEHKALDEFIDELLLEREAKVEHVTVSELLERHVNSTIAKDPSEESLRVYYEGVDTTQPFEVVHSQIVDHIRQRRLGAAKAAYLKTLRAKSNIAFMIIPPRSSVSLKDTPVLGRADAPVMIIEYADYECPYCQQVQTTLDKLKRDYKDKLSLAYKDVALPGHPRAEKAAEAARCAGKQGKYWEYHDVLFATKGLDVPQLKQYAVDLKLDGKAFDECLDAGKEAEKIKESNAEGATFSLQGTPSFFINGRFISGSLTYEEFRAIVDQELAAPAGK
jgi:predicted DsbA family dithiol-disulfide isomerase